MVGKPESPDSNSEIPDRESHRKPYGKTLECPSCGGTVKIRYPGNALRVVCESCQSVIDCNDKSYSILDNYYKKTQRYKPAIELGTRGKLFGREWEILGFVVRRDVSSSYQWDEYLLFNPYYGYRWLTCNSGHWSFVTPIKQKPVGVRSSVVTLNNDYKLFYVGQASIDFVLGEFYWKVQVGDTVSMKDYIYPPYMLSSEQDTKEISWSRSEYMAPEAVAEAFKLKTKLPAPTGVAPNQPSTVKSCWDRTKILWLVFVGFLTCMQVVSWRTALNEAVYFDSRPYVTNTKSTSTFTSPVFKLRKDKANVELRFTTPLDNNWFYVYCELVNDKTGETYPLERTIEYYHGYDGGEAWSEGSTTSSIVLSSMSAGDYYLNVDYESGGFKEERQSLLDITVLRDVPNISNYFWCLLFLTIFAILVFHQHSSFETARWKDSDFSPYSSAD